jgi:hypothetical protein
MSVRPNVFVVQQNDASRDLSSADDFGTIRYILPAGFQPSLEPQRAMEFMRRELETFRPGDFITSTGGDLAGVFIAGLIVPEFHEGSVNWLRWERKRANDGRRMNNVGFYVPSAINPLS